MKRLRYKVSPGRLKDTASSVLGSVQTVPRKSSKVARAAVGRVRTGSRQALDSTSRHADEFLAATQGLLASALSADLNGMLANMVAGPATIYDKAMDAVYHATHIGGGKPPAVRRRTHDSRRLSCRAGRVARRHHCRGGDEAAPGPLPGHEHGQGTPARELGQGDLRQGVRIPGIRAQCPERLVLRPQQLRCRPTFRWSHRGRRDGAVLESCRHRIICKARRGGWECRRLRARIRCCCSSPS